MGNDDNESLPPSIAQSIKADREREPKSTERNKTLDEIEKQEQLYALEDSRAKTDFKVLSRKTLRLAFFLGIPWLVSIFTVFASSLLLIWLVYVGYLIGLFEGLRVNDIESLLEKVYSFVGGGATTLLFYLNFLNRKPRQ